jgi:hypothetical protein
MALSISSSLPGQVTITNATFPAAGDSLKIATDVTPGGITMDPPGANYAWDYSSLTADTRQVVVYQPASNGADYASFPGADLVTIDALGDQAYFNVTSTAFEDLGLSGANIGFGLPFVTQLHFVPPLPERRAPLSFFDIHQSSSNISVAVALADLPAGLLDSLGIPSGLVDSVRIRINISRTEIADAWGTMMIPGGTYNVLRQHRTEYDQTRLDIHVPFLGWTDVTDLVQLGGFGSDTTQTYFFWNDVAKEPIAVVTTDSSGLAASSIEFKDNGAPSAIKPVIQEQPMVRIYPNPVTDEVTIDMSLLKPDYYTLSVYDFSGQLILIKDLESNIEHIQVQTLPPGIYGFKVADRNHQMVSTGKFTKE